MRDRAWIDIGNEYWDREARGYGPDDDEDDDPDSTPLADFDPLDDGRR